MNVYLEVIGRWNAKRSGTTKVAPDAFLYVAAWIHAIEFKSKDGRLSPDQIACMTERLAQQVHTHVIRDRDTFVDLVNWSRANSRSKELEKVWSAS